MLCQNSWVFLGSSGFLAREMCIAQISISIVEKVKTQLIIVENQTP